MRFGAMLWLQPGGQMGELRWFPKKKLLELVLTKDAVPLYGEVAEARFQSLARSLDAETKVRVAR